MADPVGKYVELGVGSPDNIKAFGLVKTTDTSEFVSSPTTYDNTTLINANNAKMLVLEFTTTKVTMDWDKIKTMGFVVDSESQYSAVRFEPRYNCLIDRTQLANIVNSDAQWQAVTIGEKPEDWDENWSQYYYTAHSMGTNYGENKVYRAVNSATFDPNTQYYRNDVVGHYYYLIDGDKRLRFFLGKCGISEDSLRPAINIFKRNYVNGNQTKDPQGFWCLQQKVDNNWVTTELNGTMTSGRNYSNTSGDNNFNNMFEPGDCRFLSISNNDHSYRTNWRYKTGTTQFTDQEKSQIFLSIKDAITLKEKTLTQFGFVQHDGHTYFGVWTATLDFKYYAGFEYGTYNRSEPQKSTQYSNFSDISQNGYDLRTYDTSKPISSTELPKFRELGFRGVEIDKIGVNLVVKEGQMPPDVNPDLPEVKGWTALKPILPTKRTLGSLSASNEPGFHVWDVDEDTFKKFLGNLWNWGDPASNVVEQMNEDGYVKNPLAAITGLPFTVVKGLVEAVKESKVDPLAAIQTCFALPGYIDDQVTAEGDYGRIKVAGLKLDDDFMAYCCHSETYIKDFVVPTAGLGTTQSYLDTAPYSTAEVYLPYIGMVQINPADCIGENAYIKIRYSTCVVDGTISATIECHSGMAASNPTQYGPYTSNAAYRIPIAQKDANAFDRSMGYMSAIGTGLGGIFNVVKGSLSTLASDPRNQNAIMEQGKANIGTYANASASMLGQMANSYLIPQVLRGSQLGTGSAIVCNTQDIAVIVSTPLPVYDDWKDSSLAGFMSGKIGTISEFGNEGKNFVSYSYAKLDKITATAAEIEDIKSILYGGVYQ